MIKSYLPWALASPRSLPRFSYHSVESNDSQEPLDDTKQLDALPEPSKSRRTVWLLAGTIFVVVLLAAIFGSRHLLESGRNKTESLVPTVKVHGVEFDLTDLYSSPPSEESNAAWDNFFSHGHEGPHRSVEMYHQVHCLGVIRILFYGMASLGNHSPHFQKRNEHLSHANHQSQDHSAHHGGEDPNQVQDPIPDHVEHCFDYIRESLTCAGDKTMRECSQAASHPPPEKREMSYYG